ncbi:succinyl-diaminopimelate desuccinylase [Corynebacterium sp. TAE3-ERU12]|uniref:succinyl-diaminopimelate desuccinylase n=1 Tax=Corynebacterium sp. TAE3-ERU12 TaxID=2849491 RepID=UPI001C467CE0|nr:succinyl-diaminopimelate desuccinylase [Corynebacterium sp. TAE3-ERU12]
MSYSLDPTGDPVDLTAALVDIPSQSHHEADIADTVEQVLRDIPNVTVDRVHNTLVARTHRDLPMRVILAGHLDTVPAADNLPSHRAPGADGTPAVHGLGAVDMKAGDACYLHAFATLANSDELTRDMTLVLYEAEEVAAQYNGLGLVEQQRPELLDGDVALLGEPSNAVIEAGCQGTLRIKVTAGGTRAHSARSWLGDNAVHRLSPVIARVAAYQARSVDIDGLEYREGMQVTKLSAGVANNTVPDEAWMFVNFRFAPDRSVEEAKAHFEQVLAIGDDELLSIEYDDISAAAAPGLSQPAAAELVAACGAPPQAKYGWTDVSRFAALGMPAVNLGPGDPSLCHTPGEHCPESMIRQVAQILQRYLTS